MWYTGLKKTETCLENAAKSFRILEEKGDDQITNHKRLVDGMISISQSHEKFFVLCLRNPKPTISSSRNDKFLGKILLSPHSVL
jgi:hypothetical protein